MLIQQTAAKIGGIVAEKNDSYGDAFIESSEILKILFPNGIQLKDYTVIDPLLRIFHKMKRIANNPDAFGEDAWLDIAGYGILMSWYNDKQKESVSEDYIADKADEININCAVKSILKEELDEYQKAIATMVLEIVNDSKKKKKKRRKVNRKTTKRRTRKKRLVY